MGAAILRRMETEPFRVQRPLLWLVRILIVNPKNPPAAVRPQRLKLDTVIYSLSAGGLDVSEPERIIVQDDWLPDACDHRSDPF